MNRRVAKTVDRIGSVYPSFRWRFRVLLDDAPSPDSSLMVEADRSMTS